MHKTKEHFKFFEIKQYTHKLNEIVFKNNNNKKGIQKSLTEMRSHEHIRLTMHIVELFHCAVCIVFERYWSYTFSICVESLVLIFLLWLSCKFVDDSSEL